MNAVFLSVNLFWLTNEQLSWRKLSAQTGNSLATRGLFSMTAGIIMLGPWLLISVHKYLAYGDIVFSSLSRLCRRLFFREAACHQRI